MSFPIQHKERKALSAIFQDSLERFATSGNESLRTVSEELAKQEETLRAKIRVLSGTSQKELGSFSPLKAQKFLEERECIVAELATHLKTSRTAVKDAEATNMVDRSTAKRLLLGTEDFDAAILKERAALAKSRMKLEYTILEHPTYARIGEAYLSANSRSATI